MFDQATASNTRDLTLDDFADLPRWVAWRHEVRKTPSGEQKPTKLPYNPHTGRLARIPNDPSTWGTRAQAERRWAQLKDSRPGGVGIVLGDLDDGKMLMGVDLDCSISVNAEKRIISRWACEVLDRFKSYAEVSPSGTGVKVFFFVAADDADAVRGLLGTNQDGKIKTRLTFAAGEHREIAIDRARFYAVTGRRLKNRPIELNTVSLADVRWFIEEVGPRYLAMHGGTRDSDEQPNARDESGSGYGFRFLRERKASGEDYTTAREAILADRGPAGEWANRVDERQLRRAYDNALNTPSGTFVLSANAPLEWAKAFVAEQFAHEQAPGVVHYRGMFYRFTGSHYEECDDAHLRSKVYAFLDKAVVLTKNGAVPFNPDTNKVNKTVDALKAGVNENARLQAPFWIDGREGPDPASLIACRNGLLDIQTRELLPHTPMLFNVNCLPFDYDPDAQAPQWMKFLGDLWPDQQDKQAEYTLQEMFGLMLTADTSQQKIFMLVGPKRSGKGTIARILGELLGKDNTAAPTLAGLSGEFGLQPLIDKRVAIIGDARLGPKSNASIVTERLLSISGEDAISVNRKFRDHWTGKLGVRFLVLSNELPRLPEASGTLASRFILLTLQHSFYGRENLSLTDSLKRDLPGILNWALDGLHFLREHGHFEMPQSSLDMLQELEDLSSPIRAFLRERCTVAPEEWFEKKRMFNAWRFWCEEQGVHPNNSSMFGRDLRAAVPSVRIVKRNGVRGYAGVGLSDDDEAEYERRRR